MTDKKVEKEYIGDLGNSLAAIKEATLDERLLPFDKDIFDVADADGNNERWTPAYVYGTEGGSSNINTSVAGKMRVAVQPDATPATAIYINVNDNLITSKVFEVISNLDCAFGTPAAGLGAIWASGSLGVGLGADYINNYVNISRESSTDGVGNRITASATLGGAAKTAVSFTTADENISFKIDRKFNIYRCYYSLTQSPDEVWVFLAEFEDTAGALDCSLNAIVGAVSPGNATTQTAIIDFSDFRVNVNPATDAESILNQVTNVQQFGGTIYYVSDGSGLDTNNGLSPALSLKTIGAAIALLSEGDAINITAGSYTEVGLDLNVNNCEMWFEIGAIIAPATGTGLTISGDYCKTKGSHRITGVAGQIGKLVSGEGCELNDCTVLGGGYGIRITGSDSQVNNCACGSQTVYAYDIQGDRTRIEDCNTVGIGASYGYHVNSGADTGVISDCTSVGHESGGYYIGTLSINWTIVDCSTGAGDGRWIDVDNASSNFWDIKFDGSKYKRHTFTGAGAGSENLFKITGTVNIYGLHADVETTLAADVGNVKYEMIDGASATDITDLVASASAPAGSYFAKEKKSADALTLYGSGDSELIEETDLKKAVFAINAIGTDTYIRFTWSGNAASGALHHHADWEPLSDNGFVEVV